jgi:large subunit ribosomal protein L31
VKQGIHPEYGKAVVRCSCGNTFETRATKSEIHVEICNVCHPFYTGKQKLVDTGGRVDRFRRRYGQQPPSESEQPASPAEQPPSESEQPPSPAEQPPSPS